MLTKSTTSLCRLSATMLTLLLFCACFSKGAEAQATTPLVTGSLATSLTPPKGLGQVAQTALDSFGDWLVMDWANGALYEYPAGGGAVITLAPATTFGGGANPGITLDSMNNLYVEGNYSNCILLFPWDATTNTWDGFTTVNASDPASTQCNFPPYSFAQFNLLTPVGVETQNYIQPWGMAMLPNNVLVAGSQNGTNFIFTLPIIFSPSPAAGCAATSGYGDCSPTATPGTDGTDAMTLVLLSMEARPKSVAADKFGNIYFVEDTSQSKTGAGLLGAYMIPAGDTQVPSDTDPSIVRVDPNLPSVTAVATDSNGNLYISDSTEGVFMVPNPSGTPNTAGAVLLTPVPASGQVSVDSTRGILYVPTASGGLTKVTFNPANLGSTAAGTPATTSESVLFGFNSAETPGFFVIQEAGSATPDFTLASGGTCAGGTAYAVDSSCSENVTLSPHSAGSVSAKLLVLDASSNVLGSINLQGTGTGSAVEVLPGGETPIGAGLKTPDQVAVDAAGNVYVADAGLGAVEMYPKGYGAVAAVTTVGTGLRAPTGVAVDGAGDVFIGDSGNVIEVPIGAAGLNAAGQVTIKSGLGNQLNLAADSLGNLYVADPTNKQVVKLGNPGGSFGLLGQTETDMTAGFNAPSAVAVDASGDLYVADGSNLIEVTPAGVQSTLLSTLNGATGLAVDPSGAVFVAEPGGTLRIPDLGGTLTPGSEKTVGSVTDPTSVAIDSSEDLYITDGTAEDVDFVSASASTNFGTLSSTTGTQTSDYIIVDAGNSPLNITGFSSTPDYSETATTCSGALAVGATCTAMVTFNPGPGDQGTLAGQVLVQSDAANAPVGMNVTGVGATLAASTTTISVKNATVDGAPVAVIVAPTSGTGIAPTGLVTLTISGSTLTAPVVATGTLANGAVTITPPQIPAGAYTYTVNYQGDRVYGTSSATAQVTVAVGAVMLMQAALTPSPSLVEVAGQYYVLANGIGAEEPYDGSISPFLFTYAVQVVATDNDPLIAQTVTVAGKPVANYGSVTYQGATGCSAVPVANDGTAPLSLGCLTINTANTSIPDLETTYTITPVYSPTGVGAACPASGTCPTNPNYSGVTGTPITVTALRNPVVEISSSPSSLTVTPGSSVSATLTLSSLFGFGYVGGGDTAATASLQEPDGTLLNNYTLPVQLACDGLPAYATCTFSYATPDVSDPNSTVVGPAPGTTLPTATSPCTASVGCVGPATVTMTITTNVPTGVIAGLHRGAGDVEFAAIFGFGLLGLAFGKRRTLRGLALTFAFLLLSGGIVAGISGCSTQQLGTTSSTVSPAGTYTVMVTAKQVGSRTITALPGIVYGDGNQMSLPFTMNVTVQ